MEIEQKFDFVKCDSGGEQYINARIKEGWKVISITSVLKHELESFAKIAVLFEREKK